MFQKHFPEGSSVATAAFTQTQNLSVPRTIGHLIYHLFPHSSLLFLRHTTVTHPTNHVPQNSHDCRNALPHPRFHRPRLTFAAIPAALPAAPPNALAALLYTVDATAEEAGPSLAVERGRELYRPPPRQPSSIIDNDGSAVLLGSVNDSTSTSASTTTSTSTITSSAVATATSLSVAPRSPTPSEISCVEWQMEHGPPPPFICDA